MDLPYSTTVRWDRFYYISFSLFVLALITMPFFHTASSIFWIYLVVYWSGIPGLINLHLVEVDVYELFFVVTALNLGGVKAGLLAIPYLLFLSVTSIQFQPKEVIRYGIASFITLSIIPYVYQFLGLNLLTTLYAYTIIAYFLFLLITVLIMPGDLFETIRYLMISLPIAFLTNTLYVRVLGDPAMAFFNKGMELDMTFPLIISAFVLAITGVKLFNWYSKKNEQQPAKKPITPAAPGV